jgi:hypothetical protein
LEGRLHLLDLLRRPNFICILRPFITSFCFYSPTDNPALAAKEPPHAQHHLGQTSTAYQRQSDPSTPANILGLNCLVSSGRGGVALPATKHGAGIA